MKLKLGRLSGNRGEVALFSPEGEVVEGQSRVQVESRPGEIPVVTVTFWSHQIEWCADQPECGGLAEVGKQRHAKA